MQHRRKYRIHSFCSSCRRSWQCKYEPASGTGTATIPIAPPLREALLVNQQLVLTKPTVPMRLVSDDLTTDKDRA